MKLEDQVCTLRQSKRLKELGVKQESLFYYIENLIPEIGYEGIKIRVNPKDGGVIRYYSAFTVAELGIRLPKGLGGNDGHNWSFYHRHCWKGESVGYSAHGVSSIEQDWYYNEAESRADMLIQLLETGKITIEQCNGSHK